MNLLMYLRAQKIFLKENEINSDKSVYRIKWYKRVLFHGIVKKRIPSEMALELNFKGWVETQQSEDKGEYH